MHRVTSLRLDVGVHDRRRRNSIFIPGEPDATETLTSPSSRVVKRAGLVTEDPVLPVDRPSHTISNSEEYLTEVSRVQNDYETRMVCDILEKMITNSETGHNEKLFACCQRYIELNNVDVKKLVKMRFKHETVTEYSSWHQRVFMFLENPTSSRGAEFWFGFMMLIIIVSCVAVVIQTMAFLNPIVFPEMKPIWFAVELSATLLFTAETMLRFVVHVLDNSIPTTKQQNAMKFLRKPNNIIEILTVLPTYLQMIPGINTGRLLSGFFRTMRLLRLLKFLRQYRAVRELTEAMKRSSKGLVAPSLFLAVSLLICSTALFFSENGTYDAANATYYMTDPTCVNSPPFILNKSFPCPKIPAKFVSPSQSLWWGIVTMATVGYGDFVPITALGKTIGSISMILGILFLAMPIAVISTNYTVVLQEGARASQKFWDELLVSEHECSPPLCDLPGKKIIDAVRVLGGISTIDLVRPNVKVLYLLDTLLEHTVRSMTRMKKSVVSANDAAKDNMQLWWISPDLQTERRRWPSMPVQTISGPQSFIAGAAGPFSTADFAILTPAIAESIAGPADGKSTPKSVLDLTRFSSIAQEHVEIVVTNVWDENVILMRPVMNCLVRVNGETLREVVWTLVKGGDIIEFGAPEAQLVYNLVQTAMD